MLSAVAMWRKRPVRGLQAGWDFFDFAFDDRGVAANCGIAVREAKADSKSVGTTRTLCPVAAAAVEFQRGL
jgi:hypothetical protein